MLQLRFHLPAGVPTQTLRLAGPHVSRVLVLRAGEQRSLLLAVEARSPWTLTMRVDRPVLLDGGGRLVAVQLDSPRFLEPTNRA
jgi:hypothetical protein